jgi:phosphoglycolate phosphatase
MSPPLLVFDLDGTLIDTAPDLIDTLNEILGREGLPPVPFAEARNMIGGGTRALLERGLAADGRNGFIDRLYRDFLDHYAEHIADRSRPFPGLETALDRLDDMGWRFAVCTNKLEGLSVRLLDLLGLRRRFAAVCGQDTFGVQKPDPQILLRTISRAGGDPRHAIMVGDSSNDINTARAAGVPVIAIAFGYTDIPVELLGPDRVIDDYRRLPEAISELVAQNGDRFSVHG